MSVSRSSDLVTVATYWDPMEAQIARLRLAQEGIPSFLEKECTVQMAWHFTNAIGGVRLNVPIARFAEARTLLAIKELFSDWAPTRCWELRLDGIPIVNEEEELAAARDREFKEPLAPREEHAERALRAALLGLCWEIAFLFACGHLWQFYTTDGPCRSIYRAKAVWAWWIAAIMAVVIVLIATMLWLDVSMPYTGRLERSSDDPPINVMRP